MNTLEINKPKIQYNSIKQNDDSFLLFNVIRMLQNQNLTQNHKEYQKVNGCTQRPSFGQISAIFLIATAIILHSIIVSKIQIIDQSILFIMFAFHYIFLFVVILNYFILVIIDPVDPRLLTDNYTEKEKDKNLLIYCQPCKKMVHVYSYHCKRCKRCSEEFDHHCVYVNNCIGRQNYRYFYILLLSLSSFLLLNIGEGIWVFIQDNTVYKWVGLTLVIECFLIFCPVVTLTIFHCYISCFIYKTTLEVIRQDQLAYEIQRNKQRAKNKTTRQSKQSAQSKEVVWVNAPTTETYMKRQII